MGIDTGCALMVGLIGEDFPEHIQQEIREHGDGHYGVLSEDGKYGLHSASPYFDADGDDRVWGFQIVCVDWRPAELPNDFAELIDAAKVKFRELIGAEPKVYVSANVW